MKIYDEKTIPEYTTKYVKTRKCDLCGIEARGEEWTTKSRFEINETEIVIEIRQKEGRDSTMRGKDDKKYIPKKDGLANCLTTGKENIEKWTFENMRIRRLTPTECERLQGFPDGWTEGISDTQRYKCLGNAVTVNVIQAIMEGLC